MKLAAPLIAALVLAGCAMDGEAAPRPGAARICNADRVQRFVGGPATPKLVEQVRRRSGSATARRITPNMRVTMEFRGDRVNVWVGIEGAAERISCG